MRVGLNATCFNDRPSGARQRFLGIYGALIAQHPEVEFVIYEPCDVPVASWFDGAPNVTARPTPIPSAGRLRKQWASLGYWRRTLAADRLDLFEQFNLPLVKAPDCPTILTVHDIRDALLPRVPTVRAFYRRIWHRALTGADHVITVSNTMRGEILEFHPHSSVHRIYNGVDPRTFHQTLAGGAGGFLLSVGHIEPRKDHAVLVDAVALLRNRGLTPRLTIVGRDGGSLPALREQIAARGLRSEVSVRQTVDEAELRQLYASCGMVVFPSRYEGFGIPVLEAMAVGKPLVLSDIAVFRELTEDRCLYFPVGSAGGLADTVQRVGQEPALADELVSYGKGRVPQFAFEKLAEQLFHLYQQILGHELAGQRNEA